MLLCVRSLGVSPRCEATNLANDRVEMLEKANSKFNKIIRSFTSSQQSLNDLVSCLGRNSNGRGLGFDSEILKTKPQKAKTSLFASFLSQSSKDFCNDYSCLNAKTKVECHYCTQKGHVSHDCIARLCWHH